MTKTGSLASSFFWCCAALGCPSVSVRKCGYEIPVQTNRLVVVRCSGHGSVVPLVVFDLCLCGHLKYACRCPYHDHIDKQLLNATRHDDCHFYEHDVDVFDDI
jgi:hypothetical protein